MDYWDVFWELLDTTYLGAIACLGMLLACMIYSIIIYLVYKKPGIGSFKDIGNFKKSSYAVVFGGLLVLSPFLSAIIPALLQNNFFGPLKNALIIGATLGFALFRYVVNHSEEKKYEKKSIGV